MDEGVIRKYGCAFVFVKTDIALLYKYILKSLLRPHLFWLVSKLPKYLPLCEEFVFDYVAQQVKLQSAKFLSFSTPLLIINKQISFKMSNECIKYSERNQNIRIIKRLSPTEQWKSRNLQKFILILVV